MTAPPPVPPPARAPGNPDAAARPNPVGPVVTLVGLAATALGTFALPLNDYPTGGIGFVQIRGLADGLASRPNQLFGGLAGFWWRFGVFLDLGLLVLLFALVLAGVRGGGRVGSGIGIAVLAVAGGIVHGVAMGTSADYLTFTRYFGSRGRDYFDAPGSGLWVSLAGFAVLAVGGVLTAVTGRRRSAVPPPPPPWPAAPPR